MTSQKTNQNGLQITLSLEKTIYTRAQMESVAMPQVALAGRSNVGKSSLINCLGNRKNLAKTSSTPGKTRSVNYYLVRPGDFYLVDLPGYGYARRSKSERQAWGKLMDHFFRQNTHLVGLLLILDARLPPQIPDMDLTALAQGLNLPILPVLTKTDKCTQRQCIATRKNWQDVLGPDVDLLFFSSKTRQGREQLWSRIQVLMHG
ncbi:MAG TPA: YihA family ribosome biogenesis GTP-binding protein [Desulfonatronum sp.]|nr:YihA family ribosome biogenesis GTP-binding protein [Desulfonatronum sp.]